MRRTILVLAAAYALAAVLATPAAPTSAPTPHRERVAERSAPHLAVPPAPDLTRCGGWQAEACEPILDAYARRVGARLTAARGTAPRLPATARAEAVTGECPPRAYPGAVCGHVEVPLDRNDLGRGTISIAFELYVHSDPGPATSAILYNPGGPGGGTIPDRSSAFYLFGPLLADHDLLLIDDRGRGYSALIDCPSLQHAVGTIPEQLEECAGILGEDVDRYGTGDVAMDTDAVRDALGYELIDYYGVSYGGADINAYATRFPEHIRSLVLDAPWGDTIARREEAISASLYVKSTLDVIRIICERSPTCSAELDDPAGDFGSLVEHVRADPVSGRATSSDGSRISVTIDPKFVNEYLMYPWGVFTQNREIAAAAVALERGDPVPLLRLGAEGYYPLCCEEPPDEPPRPPIHWSMGSYVATYCADTEWEWDWASPIDERIAEHAARIGAQPAELFTPFTGAEATDSTFVGPAYCIYWPDPTGSSPIAPPNAVYPNVPTLVIGGDLDNVVPLQVAEWMAALFPDSHYVEIAGAGHGAAFWSSCALDLVQGFVATLELGDTSCADTPEFSIPAVGEFPRVAGDATPARPFGSGRNEVGKSERRVAAVAAAAVRDALARAELAFGGPGEVRSRGLRGGRVRFRFTGADGLDWIIRLDRVRFAEDVRLDGVIRWIGPTVRASLRVSGAGTAGGHLWIRMHHFPEGRWARITGELGGRAVRLRVPQA